MQLKLYQLFTVTKKHRKAGKIAVSGVPSIKPKKQSFQPSTLQRNF